MNYKELYNQVIDFSDNKTLLSKASFILMTLRNKKELSRNAKEEELEKLFYSIKKDNSKIKKRDRKKLEKLIDKNNITFKESTKEEEKIEMFLLNYKYKKTNMIGGCSIYININRDQLYTLLQKVVKSYTKEDLPFRCEAGSTNNYNYQLEFIIPADKAPRYVELLQEIGDKSLRIKKSCETPPIFAGNIDNWLGFICNTDEKNPNRVIDDDIIINEIMTAFKNAESIWKKNQPNSTDYYRSVNFIKLFQRQLKQQINRPKLSFSETAEKYFVKNPTIKKQHQTTKDKTTNNKKSENQEILDDVIIALTTQAVKSNYNQPREKNNSESLSEYIQYLKGYKLMLDSLNDQNIVNGKYHMTKEELKTQESNKNIGMTEKQIQHSKQKIKEFNIAKTK